MVDFCVDSLIKKFSDQYQDIISTVDPEDMDIHLWNLINDILHSLFSRYSLGYDEMEDIALNIKPFIAFMIAQDYYTAHNKEGKTYVQFMEDIFREIHIDIQDKQSKGKIADRIRKNRDSNLNYNSFYKSDKSKRYEDRKNHLPGRVSDPPIAAHKIAERELMMILSHISETDVNFKEYVNQFAINRMSGTLFPLDKQTIEDLRDTFQKFKNHKIVTYKAFNQLHLFMKTYLEKYSLIRNMDLYLLDKRIMFTGYDYAVRYLCKGKFKECDIREVLTFTSFPCGKLQVEYLQTLCQYYSQKSERNANKIRLMRINSNDIGEIANFVGCVFNGVLHNITLKPEEDLNTSMIKIMQDADIFAHEIQLPIDDNTESAFKEIQTFIAENNNTPTK